MSTSKGNVPFKSILTNRYITTPSIFSLYQPTKPLEPSPPPPPPVSEPNSCPRCLHTVTDMQLHMNKHLLWDSGNAPFSCDICQLSFGSPFGFAKHCSIIHDVSNLAQDARTLTHMDLVAAKRPYIACYLSASASFPLYSAPHLDQFTSPTLSQYPRQFQTRLGRKEPVKPAPTRPLVEVSIPSQPIIRKPQPNLLERYGDYSTGWGDNDTQSTTPTSENERIESQSQLKPAQGFNDAPTLPVTRSGAARQYQQQEQVVNDNDLSSRNKPKTRAAARESASPSRNTRNFNDDDDEDDGVIMPMRNEDKGKTKRTMRDGSESDGVGGRSEEDGIVESTEDDGIIESSEGDGIVSGDESEDDGVFEHRARRGLQKETKSNKKNQTRRNHSDESENDRIPTKTMFDVSEDDGETRGRFQGGSEDDGASEEDGVSVHQINARSRSTHTPSKPTNQSKMMHTPSKTLIKQQQLAKYTPKQTKPTAHHSKQHAKQTHPYTGSRQQFNRRLEQLIDDKDEDDEDEDEELTNSRRPTRHRHRTHSHDEDEDGESISDDDEDREEELEEDDDKDDDETDDEFSRNSSLSQTQLALIRRRQQIADPCSRCGFVYTTYSQEPHHIKIHANYDSGDPRYSFRCDACQLAWAGKNGMITHFASGACSQDKGDKPTPVIGSSHSSGSSSSNSKSGGSGKRSRAKNRKCQRCKIRITGGLETHQKLHFNYDTRDSMSQPMYSCESCQLAWVRPLGLHKHYATRLCPEGRSTVLDGDEEYDDDGDQVEDETEESSETDVQERTSVKEQPKNAKAPPETCTRCGHQYLFIRARHVHDSLHADWDQAMEDDKMTPGEPGEDGELNGWYRCHSCEMAWSTVRGFNAHMASKLCPQGVQWCKDHDSDDEEGEGNQRGSRQKFDQPPGKQQPPTKKETKDFVPVNGKNSRLSQDKHDRREKPERETPHHINNNNNNNNNAKPTRSSINNSKTSQTHTTRHTPTHTPAHFSPPSKRTSARTNPLSASKTAPRSVRQDFSEEEEDEDEDEEDEVSEEEESSDEEASETFYSHPAEPTSRRTTRNSLRNQPSQASSMLSGGLGSGSGGGIGGGKGGRESRRAYNQNQQEEESTELEDSDEDASADEISSSHMSGSATEYEEDEDEEGEGEGEGGTEFQDFAGEGEDDDGSMGESYMGDEEEGEDDDDDDGVIADDDDGVLSDSDEMLDE